jgi:hypothetical protein
VAVYIYNYYQGNLYMYDLPMYVYPLSTIHKTMHSMYIEYTEIRNMAMTRCLFLMYRVKKHITLILVKL